MANSLRDPSSLRARLEAGGSVRDIATDLGVKERTVRYWMDAHAIPAPAKLHRASIDVEAVLRDYQAGTPIRILAARHRVGQKWVRDLLAAHGVKRTLPPNRSARGSRHPELNDRSRILRRLAAGDSVYGIARTLGADRSVVKAALRRHGIRTARGTDRATWAEQLEQPADRYVAAAAIAEAAEAARQRADDLRSAAIAEMHAAGLSYATIGRTLGLSAAEVRGQRPRP